MVPPKIASTMHQTRPILFYFVDHSDPRPALPPFRTFFIGGMRFSMHKSVTESFKIFSHLMIYLDCVVRMISRQVKNVRFLFYFVVQHVPWTTLAQIGMILSDLVRFWMHKFVTGDFSFPQESGSRAFQNGPYLRARQGLPSEHIQNPFQSLNLA